MHHTRRKSGHVSVHTSMTDVRKAVTTSDTAKQRRPQLPPRKATTQPAHKLGKNPRHREKEWDEKRWCHDERETFPQYCMTCEKQFLPRDESVLYCSEACRNHDQHASMMVFSRSPAGLHGCGGNLPFYSAGNPEPRDIIPQAAPSRPSSMQFMPSSPSSYQHSNAGTAPRTLDLQAHSPPSPSAIGSGIWPFTRSTATSPSSSYTTPNNYFSTTYDSGYGTSVQPNGFHTTRGLSSDRPLPLRKPGSYSRPKSIELVTPMVGRY